MDFWHIFDKNERLTQRYVSVFHRFPERVIMVINERNSAVHYQFRVSLQYQGAVIWLRMYKPECLLKIKWNLTPHTRTRMKAYAKSVQVNLVCGIHKAMKRQYFCSKFSCFCFHWGFCLLYSIIDLPVFRVGLLLDFNFFLKLILYMDFSSVFS